MIAAHGRPLLADPVIAIRSPRSVEVGTPAAGKICAACGLPTGTTALRLRGANGTRRWVCTDCGVDGTNSKGDAS